MKDQLEALNKACSIAEKAGLELLKSHVRAYTRTDGTQVAEHEDSRNASGGYTKPDHCKNMTDEAHHLSNLPRKRTQEEEKRYGHLLKRIGFHNQGLSPEYKQHLKAPTIHHITKEK